MPLCGRLISRGHEVGGRVHARAYYSRCKRLICPECWDKPHGWLGRNADRLEKGLLRGTFPGAAQHVGELILRVRAERALFFDSGYLRRLVEQLRKRLGQALAGAGAWIRHMGATEDDACPDGPHLHVFGVVGGVIPSTFGIGPHPIRFVGRDRIPGLSAALRGVVLPRWNRPGMRERPVPVVGWFGRRRTAAQLARAKEERVSSAETCQLCHEEIPTKKWRRVVHLRRVIEVEGPWEASVEEVRWVNPDPPAFVSREDRRARELHRGARY